MNWTLCSAERLKFFTVPESDVAGCERSAVAMVCRTVFTPLRDESVTSHLEIRASVPSINFVELDLAYFSNVRLDS